MPAGDLSQLLRDSKGALLHGLSAHFTPAWRKTSACRENVHFQ